MTDETPNTHGSPGLWGFSNDHEIYYDNVLVTPNASATARRRGKTVGTSPSVDPVSANICGSGPSDFL